MNTILPVQLEVPWKPLLRWSASLVGFPLAGIAARAVAGSVDGPSPAILGGLAAGAMLGAVQALVLPAGVGRRATWAAATIIGMTLGLVAGAGAVGYRTDPQSLAVMGAINGGFVGLAQAAVARLSPGRRIAWALLTPVLWAIGWFITANVIVDGDQHHATFGSSGAIVVSVASGLLLTVRVARAASRSQVHPGHGKAALS